MRSLRGKLLLGILSGAGVLCLAYGATLYQALDDFLLGHLDDTLETRARAIAALVELDGDRVRVDVESDLLEEYEAGSDVDYFQILDERGEVVASSKNLGGARLELPDAPPDEHDGWSVPLPGGREGRALAFELPYDVDGDEGLLLLVLATDRSLADEWLGQLFQPLVLAGVLFALALFAWIRWIVGHGLEPLRRVTDDLARIDASTLGWRLSTERLPGELLPVARCTNALLERLETAFERERRTTSNIAHELRTPIAELRGLTEVARRWSDDTSFLERTVDEAHHIAREMERVVTTILRTARAQAGQLELVEEELSLSDVLADALSSVREAAERKRVRIAVETIEGMRVRADRGVLDLIVSNLLSNAVEYATGAGDVVCRGRRDGDELRIAFENPSTELDGHDVEHMTEAFWRKDASRSEAGHAGLGLVLVSELARSSGLGFELALDGERFRAELTLPAA